MLHTPLKDHDHTQNQYTDNEANIVSTRVKAAVLFLLLHMTWAMILTYLHFLLLLVYTVVCKVGSKLFDIDLPWVMSN